MPQTDDLLLGLTDAQRDAVAHIDGPQLVLAGPGSGKTRVVTHRIAYLLRHGIADRSILALTFTNKAANEMRSRLARLAPGSNVWISTFHRFCARLLRRYASYVGLAENFTIYDTDDSRRLLRGVLRERDYDTDQVTPDRIGSAISAAKNRLLSPEDFAPSARSVAGSIAAKVYPEYQARLLANNAVDFDDLLFHTAVLLRDNPEVRRALDDRYRYILVDEYQDTNLPQYLIVRALSNDYPNLSVTGDPDQSIYGWRGANLKNILDFEKDYPDVQVVRLERNYRSTKRILRVADQLISHNVRRKAKLLHTENDEGQPVRLVAHPTQQEEAQQIAARIAADMRAGRRRARDFAIFYRINALSRSLEIALREQGVPFQLVNSVEFYQRMEIKDVMAYLHLMNNPRNDVALQRIINTPPRGIGKKTIECLAEHARRTGTSLLQAARECGMIESLTKRAAVAVAKFVSMFDAISEHAHAPVEEILGHVLSASGYEEHLTKSDAAEDEERLANIQELLTAARQFDEHHSGDNALEAFLEQASLVNDTDGLETDADHVMLMTIHSAKGLEFPVVYVIALEHGILPHERSLNDADKEEEERRLLFVAITRACEELYLSHAVYRAFRGQQRMTVPSHFLLELPREEMEVIESSWSPRSAYATPTPSRWEDDEEVWSDDGGDRNRQDRAAETATADDISFPFGAAADEDCASQEASAAGDASSSRQAAALASLTTAAEMSGSAKSPQAAVSPDAFALGMPVRHPEYGLGKIVALSGNGVRRMATVQFVATAAQKKFVLVKSPLRPAR
ncbi:MAG: UvrD-helicase domain-containing protein [Pirellulales bacterium]